MNKIALSRIKGINPIEKNQLPREWKYVTLEDIAEQIYYGITAKAIENKTELRILRTTDIINYSVNWNKLPFCEITEKRNNVERYFLRKNDLIIARAGTIGISILVNKDFNDTIFGSYLIKVKLRKGISPKFIHYFCQSSIYWRHLQSAQGSTLKNINLPLLKSLKLPLPPLPEQQKIAEILSTVDKAIEKVDESIAKTERLKKGLMQKLLTKGIGHKEFKDTEIGRIPKEWEVVKLDTIVDIETGKRAKGGGLSKGNVASIGGEHIDQDGNILWDKMKFISESFYENLNQGRVKLGDILMVKDGATTGKTCIVRSLPYEKVAVNEHVFLIRSKVKVITEFLFYVLFSKVGQNQIKLRFHGLIGGIKRGDIKSIIIPLPPLPEQQKIAEILSTVDKRLELLRNKKERLGRIKKGLMNDLLTGKRRVRVDKS